MNLKQKLRAFIRNVAGTTLAYPAQWLIDAWCGEKSASGESVNEKTAMGLSAYLACVKNISEDVAKLPFGIYERLEPRGRKYKANHAVSRILHDEANDEMSAMSFRETITQHALGWHGGFAEIVRNGVGPVALYPLDPTCVTLRRDDDRRLYYEVHGQRFAPRDIFHLHGLGYDGLTGYVIARLAKDSLGNAIAAQKFAGSYFANGATSTGVLEVPNAMSETAFKHLRESFMQRHTGAGNQNKPIILEEGAKWNPTSSDPQKSQMLEIIQHGAEETCRLFRMPPHKIQHLLRATFTNIESQALEYVIDCLLGWVLRWEQEVNRKLLMPQERKRLYSHHNVNMLLRGDMAARSAFYREGFNIGWLSDNDIREYEDLNPIEGGDTYFVNAALVPLEMAAKGDHLAANQPQAAPQESVDAPADDEADTEDADATAKAAALEHKRELVGRVAAAHTAQLENALTRILEFEHSYVLAAMKKHNSEAIVTKFYESSHKSEVAGRLMPVMAALSVSMEAVTCS